MPHTPAWTNASMGKTNAWSLRKGSRATCESHTMEYNSSTAFLLQLRGKTAYTQRVKSVLHAAKAQHLSKFSIRSMLWALFLASVTLQSVSARVPALPRRML